MQRQKIIILTAIIITLFSALIVGGYYIYQKMQAQISELKDYENFAYAFSFQYPANWFLTDLTMPGQGNPNLQIHIQNNTEGFPKASNSWKTASFFDVKVTKISENASLTSYVQDSKIRKINIGDKQYDAGIPFDDPFDLTSASNAASLIYIINEGKLYVISYSAANIDEYKNNKKIFIDSLSTFKLTTSRTDNRKTYKNDEFGFELKYPEIFSTATEGPNSAQKDLDEGKTISGTIVPSYQTISFRNLSGSKKFEISVFHKIDKAINKENYENFFYSSGLCDLRYLYAEPDIKLIQINNSPVLEVSLVAKTAGLSRSCYYLKNDSGNLIVLSLSAPESQADFETTNKIVKDILSTIEFTK